MAIKIWTEQTVLEKWPFDDYDRRRLAEGNYPYLSDYTPIVESFGDVLVHASVGSYQGDDYALVYDSAEGYAFVEIGWGSCSGCDALQACGGLAEVAALRNDIYATLTYRSPEDLLAWMRSHDWKGDFGWYDAEKRKAIRRIIDHLAGVVNQPKKDYGTAASNYKEIR